MSHKNFPEAPDKAVTSQPAPSPSKPSPSSGGTVVRLVVPPRGARKTAPDATAESERATEAEARRETISDEALIAAVQSGERWAAAALLERYSPMVERLIRRVLGRDEELEDLTQDALTTVLTSIHQVRDGAAVRGWIAQIAVHTAHRAIRKRRVYRWLLFWAPRPEVTVDSPVGCRESLRRVYAALESLPATERVPFALRFIEEMPLEEVAAACDVSLATIKRRLCRAERKFLARAQRDPVLSAHIEEGNRWTLD